MYRGLINWGRGTSVAVEFGEEVVLDLGYGFGVALGDLGSGFGLASGLFGFTDGALGLFGEKVAVGFGLGVALGDGGGDAGAWGCGRGARSGGGGCAVAAGAVRGETLGDLLPEDEGLERSCIVTSGFEGGFVQ
jgi:hypothetical protein